MNMPRRVEPEWLDELPPGDPHAMRSRCDLRRINTLMTNAAIVARDLVGSRRDDPPRAIAEIGAGDGAFMLRLAARVATRWRNVRVVLLDRHDVVGRETLDDFIYLGWTAESATADVFEWLARPAELVFDVMIANLFLHHFDASRLRTLFALAAQRTRMFVACEPRRSGLALIGSRLLGVAGCNAVTRHDAVVSVREGFYGRELSALWPESRVWTMQERPRGLFSHGFVARRVGDNGFSGEDRET